MILPRAKETKLGWTIDPEVLMQVSHEIEQEGWDSCLEIVELAMLAAERMILKEGSQDG